MSSLPAISRSQGSADEFERRLRASGQQPAASGGPDALSELQRLIGQSDPFKDVFAARSPSDHGGRAEPVFGAAAEDRRDPHEAGAGTHAHPGDVFAALERELRGPLDGSDAGEPEAHHAASHYVDQHDAVEPSPDIWAQGEASDETFDDMPVPPQTRAESAPSASSARTLLVLAAVVALTGGGLAASFLARPSGAAANVANTSAGNAPPVIMALSGPSKVQPPASANGSDGASEPSSLLDKNHDDGTAKAKVVNTIEQPVDLAQAIKSTAAKTDVTAPPTATAAPNPFPEPRKVKTIVVRPDGSFVSGGDSAAAAPAVQEVTAASLAFDARTAIPLNGDQQASAASATPETATTPSVAAASAPASAKTANRAGASPRPAAPAVSTAAADPDAAMPAKPKPATARVKSKPVEQASAADDTDNTASTGSGGAYAVQLGAPPSQQEARESSSRLQKKFADALGAYRPAIREGKSGDRTVYRIRVSNLSLEDARSLCSKLQSSGGACFVVHN